MDELFSNKTPEEQKRETKVKRKLLLVGVFGYGLTMFASTIILDFHQDPTHARTVYYGFPGIAEHLAGSLAVGYFWGYWMWRYTKRNW